MSAENNLLPNATHIECVYLMFTRLFRTHFWCLLPVKAELVTRKCSSALAAPQQEERASFLINKCRIYLRTHRAHCTRIARKSNTTMYEKNIQVENVRINA